MTIFTSTISFFRKHLKAKALDSYSYEEDRMLLSRHQVLVENLAAALIIRNTEGTITYCSPFTEVMCGFPLSSIYESGEKDFFLRIVHPSDKASLTRSLHLAKLGESFQMRHRFFHHSGFEMWIESRTAPLFDESKRLIASLTLMMDVTSAVRFEEQMQERNHDLQEITAIAAEEIQNEVFTLKGMLALVDEDIPVETMKAAVRISAEKLEGLAQGLTEFGKASSERRELRSLLPSRLLHAFQERANESIAIHLPEEEIPVIAEEEELLEVLSSLSRYSHALCPQGTTPEIEVQVIQENTETKVLHLDSAPTIPETFIDHIFYPKSVEHGERAIQFGGKRTPFSLSLSQKRVRRMGGTLDFQVSEDGRNCFVITLKSRPSANRLGRGRTLDTHP
jgi:PAS domain S-box-containing protein